MIHLKRMMYGVAVSILLALSIWAIKSATIWFMMWDWSPLFFKVIFGAIAIYLVGGTIDSCIAALRKDSLK
jgi:hypothetical protein